MHRSGPALLASLAMAVGLLLLSGIADNLAASVPYYPAAPQTEDPQTVSSYFCSAFRGSRVDNPPVAVQDFIVALHQYGRDFHDAAFARYQWERLIGWVSPAHVSMEISNQLLQDRFDNALDVFDPDRPGEPSTARSLTHILPESAWIVICLVSLIVLNARAFEKLEA